jgi:DNA-binding response OmpR family regulator
MNIKLPQPSNDEHIQSILIVDDNEMVLDLLSKGFEMYGLNVFKAGNGFEGLRIFEKERIDIVLTDIQMPDLNGIELSLRIRNQSPSITLALMTGGEGETAIKLLNDGTAKYLFKKPFAISYVCQSLLAETPMA